MSLVFTLGALIGLQVWQGKLSNQASQAIGFKKMIFSYGVTIMMAVLTNVVNYILSYAIEKLTNFERHQTKTDRLASLIVKTSITQFINTSIIYYIIFKIYNNAPLTN